MKYFLHDSSAFQDEKITELFMAFGYEGLGLFYTILEKLAHQEKPIKTPVLKKQLRVGKRLEKCWAFIEEIGLISSRNGESFNENLLNFSEKYQIKKEKTRKRVEQWRDNKDLTESVTRYERVRNTPKVKESKVKEIDTIGDVVESVARDSEKEPKTTPSFIKPTEQEVKAFFIDKTGLNGALSESFASQFVAFYESNGWKVGKNKMKSWKHAASGTWLSRDDWQNKIIQYRANLTPPTQHKHRDLFE